MRSRILTGLAGVALAATMAGCGSVDAADESGNDSAADAQEWTAPEGLEGELTYYSANPQGLTDDLVSAFEEKTGVTVNVFSGETGKITAKLKAEQANPQADVVYLASWSAAQSQSKTGAFEKFEPEGADKVHEGWASESGDFTGRDGSALGLVANTEALEGGEAPQDWEDLADPKYKDKVIMPDPRESGTAADLVAAMVDKWGEDKTWELFDSLFDNGMQVQGANGPALDAVTSGSKAVVFGGVDYSAYAAKAKGEPLEFAIPSSGTTVTPRPILVSDDSDNKEAAEAFVDFMFSDEGQAISADNYMIPAVEGVEPAEGEPYDDIDRLTDDHSGLSEASDGVTETFVSRYLK